MRIISGEFGGLKLKPVPSDRTRPTTDKIKEAIFSMLMPYLDGGNSLDLYAGTGGLSIEGVSRGVDHAVMVDQQGLAVKIIKENVATTKASERFTVMKASAQQALQHLATESKQFDFVYFDPPYAKQVIAGNMQQLVELDLLTPHAIIMTETESHTAPEPDPAQFELVKQKHYGITAIDIFRYIGGN